MNQSPICSTPYCSVDDVLTGLRELERHYLDAVHPHATFLTAYFAITRTLDAWIRNKRFACGDVTQRYVIAFANRYRESLDLYHKNQHEHLPSPWFSALAEENLNGRSWLESLLLGINAHINYDLAFAVVDAEMDTQSPVHYADHVRVNQALQQATPQVRSVLIGRYATTVSARAAGKMFGPWIDKLTGDTFKTAREDSWRWARSISMADGDSMPAFEERLACSANQHGLRLKQLCRQEPLSHAYYLFKRQVGVLADTPLLQPTMPIR